MRLAFGHGNLDKVLRRQAIRQRQNRPGDRDFIVTRQRVDNLDWRIVNRREALAELDEGIRLHPGHQMPQHVIENLDLHFAKPFVTAQKQICDAPEGFRALFARAASYGIFEFRDQQAVLIHRVRSIGAEFQAVLRSRAIY